MSLVVTLLLSVTDCRLISSTAACLMTLSTFSEIIYIPASIPLDTDTTCPAYAVESDVMYKFKSFNVSNTTVASSGPAYCLVNDRGICIDNIEIYLLKCHDYTMSKTLHNRGVELL